MTRHSREPADGSPVTALVAVAGIADAVSLARRARDELAPHGRIELVESAGVELVAEAAGTHPRSPELPW